MGAVRPVLVLSGFLALVALMGLLGASPAQAGQQVVVVQLGTGAPGTVTLQAGDEVVFRNAESGPDAPDPVDLATPRHRVVADVPGGLDERLGPGQSTDARVLTQAGTYAFTDSRSVGPGQATARPGSLVVTAPAPAPAPDPAPSAAGPAPAAEPAAPAPAPAPAAPSPAPASPAPATLGGKGIASASTLSLGGLLPGTTATAGPAPLVAPDPTGDLLAGELLGGLPGGGGADPAVLLAGGGSLSPLLAAPAARPALPQPPTPRRYGLPVALAVLGLLGVGSLLVRTLLAEPVPPRP